MVYKGSMTPETPSGVTSRPTSPAKRSSTRHWVVALGAAMLMIAASFVFLSFSLINPQIAETLGVGLSQVMVYNSLMAVSGALSMTFLSPWAIRTLGARGLVIVGGALTAGTLLGFSFVTSLAMLYILGFSLGLTFAICTNMMASVLVNNWFAANRGSVLGIVFAISGLGGITMGFVMPGIISSGGWQLGFRLLAVLVLVLTAVPGILMIRSEPADVGLLPLGATAHDSGDDVDVVVTVPGVPRAVAFRSPQFLALEAALILTLAVMAVQQHFAPLMAERGAGFAAAGSLLSLSAFVSIFATMTMGTLNDRVSTLAAVWFALACQLASMVAFIFSDGYLPLAISTALFAFGGAMPMVLVPVIVMLLFGPKDFAAILGPTMAMVPIGMAIGTPLWGLVYDRTGSYTPGLVVAAGASVVTAALLTWAIRTAPGLRTRVERELYQGYEAEVAA